MNISGIAPTIVEDAETSVDTDADFIANKGLTVAKSLIGALEDMLNNTEVGGINVQDLKDITSMLKDVFVMIEKYDKQVGGGRSSESVDDGLALFLSRRKA